MNLQGLVSQSYPSPEWAVFFEVSNSTGFGARRRADAVALGVWPSRGQAVIGFEFKEDRRDWLREKENPAKAEEIAAHCDVWWMVAGKAGIVKPEELPEPWGLYVANDDRTRLKVAKQATPFPDRDKAVMKRTFVAAMLRKITENTVPKSELDRLVQVAVKQAVENTSAGREVALLRETVERQRATFETFKELTGLDMAGLRGPRKLAAAVDAILHMDTNKDMLARTVTQLERTAQTVREAIEAWPVSTVGE